MVVMSEGLYRITENEKIQRIAAEYIEVDSNQLAGYIAGHFNIPKLIEEKEEFNI